jgi:hypothetical protein
MLMNGRFQNIDIPKNVLQLFDLLGNLGPI